MLAIVLLVVAGGFAYAGKRLSAPLAITRPGGVAAGFMIAIWRLAIYTVVIAAHVYGLEVKQAYPGFVAARVRVGTFVYAAVTFFVILYLARRWGWKVALASAVIGAAAAPMIFELPFDLIVMARTNPPIPVHPMLYRQLFFLPLFLVQLSTILLLTLLPSMRVTAYTCYAVAAMLLVFAVWAAFGFAFPTEPLPFALTVKYGRPPFRKGLLKASATGLERSCIRPFLSAVHDRGPRWVLRIGLLALRRARGAR